MKNQSQLLEERLVTFSQNVIELSKKIPRNIISDPLVSQLIKSATSIGANYFEANNASSKQDFRAKIFICKKESQETKYWLILLQKELNPKHYDKVSKLYQECHEFNLIFQKIIYTLKNNKMVNGK